MRSPAALSMHVLSLGTAVLLGLGQPALARSLRFETELAEANGVEAPYEASNALHLNAQKYTTGAELPPFDRLDFRIEVGRLTVRSGEARHTFTDIDVLQFAVDRDRDKLMMLDRSGAVYAVDMYLFRGIMFLAPVPVFQVDQVTLPPGEADDFRIVIMDKDVTASLYRGFNDWDLGPLDEDKARAWEAGDVAVLRKHGYKTKIVKEIPGDQIDRELGTIEETLKFFTDMAHPYGESGEAAERNSEIEWPAMLALQSLDQDTLHRLVKNPEYWHKRARRQRDRYRYEGEHEVPLPDLDEARKWVTPKKMMLLAGAALGAEAALEVAKRYEVSLGLVQAIGVTFANWAGLVSPVLVDAEYRKLLFKSALAMSLLPPAMWAVATLVDRTYTKNGDAGLTLVQGGMRAFGWLNEPFWRRTATVLRQPYLIRALSLGLNPFKTVDPDSALGKKAELDRPTRMGWTGDRDTHEATHRLVRTVEKMQAKRFALAHWLALVVVTEEQRLDPATVQMLLESENPAAKRALKITPEMNRRRLQVAFELALDLDARSAHFDVDHLDVAEVERELARAREKLGDVGRRAPMRRTFDRFRREWASIKTSARRGLYDFARAENHFWRTARPKESLGEQNKTMFFTDYYEGLFYTALQGSRADPNDLAALMAQRDAFLFTNPGARFDVMDTGRWYALNMPALLSGQYQRDQIEAGRAYNAREEKLIKPIYSGPGLVKGLGYWLNDFRNPSTGRYGEIILNRFRLSTRMMQTTYLLTTTSRVLLAGADFATSSYNYLLHFIIGHPFIGLIWDGIIPTNERMYARYENNRTVTEAAIGKIYRGLRMGEPETWAAGMQESIKLFQDPQARPSREMKEYIEKVNTYMFDSPSAEQARELMFRLLEKPPLPGKEPKWIEVGASLVGVFVSTYLGLKMSVLTFRPDLNWPHLLMQATGASLVFYGTVAAMTKGWRWWQKKQREECEVNLLTPELRAAIRSAQ